MAETALGVVGLLGLYSACQDCFEDVQVARRCGEDYARLQCQLDLLNVKFTRWGSAAGLDKALTPIREEQISTTKVDEGQTVRQTLEQVIKDFEQCRKRSEPYRKTTQVYNADSDLDPANQSIHQTLRAICSRRVMKASSPSKGKAIPIITRMKWAFHDRKRFEGLVLGLNDLITDLVELFPNENDRRVGEEIEEVNAGLAKLQVDQKGSQQALQALHDAAAVTDQAFATALASVICNARNGYQIKGQHHSHNAFTLYGDQILDETMVGKSGGGGSAYDIASGKHEGSAYTVYGSVYGSIRK